MALKTMSAVQKITVVLIEGTDKVSRFSRWLGFGQYVAVGFVYPTNIGQQRDSIMLFNAFNHQSPAWAEGMSLDSLTTLPHIIRIRCHKLSMTESDITAFRLTLSIILSERSKIGVSGSDQILNNLRGKGQIVNGFTLVNKVLSQFTSTKEIPSNRLLDGNIVGSQYDLTLRPNSNGKDEIEVTNKTTLLDLMQAFTNWTIGPGGPSLDLHPKMEVDKASETLHEIYAQLENEVPILDMEKLGHLHQTVTGQPAKTTSITSTSGLTLTTSQLPNVSLIKSKLLITPSGVDLKHIESNILKQVLSYLSSVSEFDSRFVGLEQEIVKELSNRSKSDKV